MANRRKRLSLAASTPIHSPGGSEETDRDSPMVIAQDEVKAQTIIYTKSLKKHKFSYLYWNGNKLV